MALTGPAASSRYTLLLAARHHEEAEDAVARIVAQHAKKLQIFTPAVEAEAEARGSDPDRPRGRP